jgi:hypothetical protein
MLHNRNGFYSAILLGKYVKRETHQKTYLSNFRRINLSLAGCSLAEPTSVSIEQSKKLNKSLYLQTVEKGIHVQNNSPPRRAHSAKSAVFGKQTNKAGIRLGGISEIRNY